MLDKKILRDFFVKELDSDIELYHHCLDAFTRLFLDFKNTTYKNDNEKYAQLKEKIHKIKPCCIMFGAHYIMPEIQSFEGNIKSGNFSAAQELHVKICDDLASILSEIDAISRVIFNTFDSTGS